MNDSNNGYSEIPPEDIKEMIAEYHALGMLLATQEQLETWVRAQAAFYGNNDPSYNDRLEIVTWASENNFINDPDFGEGIVYYMYPAQIRGEPIVK